MDDKNVIRTSICRRNAFIAAKAAWFVVTLGGAATEKRAAAIKAAEERAAKSLGTLLLYEEGPSALEGIISATKPSPASLPEDWVKEAGFTAQQIEEVRCAMIKRSDALEESARALFRSWLVAAKPGQGCDDPSDEEAECFLKHKPSISELTALVKSCQRAKGWALRDALQGNPVALLTDAPLIQQTEQRLQALLDAAEEAAEEKFEQRPATIEEMVARL